MLDWFITLRMLHANNAENNANALNYSLVASQGILDAIKHSPRKQETGNKHSASISKTQIHIRADRKHKKNSVDLPMCAKNQPESWRL